jgi:hypothetical protein
MLPIRQLGSSLSSIVPLTAEGVPPAVRGRPATTAIAVGIDAARTDVANDGLYRTLGLAVGGRASGIRSVYAVRFTATRFSTISPSTAPYRRCCGAEPALSRPVGSPMKLGRRTSSPVKSSVAQNIADRMTRVSPNPSRSRRGVVRLSRQPDPSTHRTL